MACFYKNSGSVFTVGAGNIAVQWKASTPLNAVAMTGTSCLDQAEATRFQMPASANLADNALAAIGSKGMRLFFSGADPGGTGSTCSLLLAYYILPSIVTTVGTTT